MIDDLLESATTLVGKFIPDRTKQIELAHEVATLANKQTHEIAKAQIEVNKIEQASPSLYKSGWRPFIGWVCGCSFAYHFVFQPMLVFGFAVGGIAIPPLPEFDMGTLMTVLGGLLGLGSLRTYEKFKGVA